MKLHAIVVAGLAAWSGLARAEPAADLQADGERLAKQGNYAAAIDKFKAADRIEPRASHACLIALAYTRRNLWPQAEIWRTTCHERASASDPLPEWMPAADKQIDDAIATANVAPVTIRVEPTEAAATAQLTVSSFAPDETFAPRVIHLPPGIHTIFARAPGFADAQQLVEVKDRHPRVIVLTLHRPGEQVAAPPAPAAAPAPPRSKVPWIVIGAGAALGVAAGIYHVTLYRDAYDQLNNAKTPTEYRMIDATGTYDFRRKVVIGLYGAAAVTLGVGIVLRYTVFAHAETAPAVAFVPEPGGGVVSLGWIR